MENSLILQTVAAEEQHQRAPRLLTEKKAKRKRGHFEIECILKERRTLGKARRWYLVRWAGYEPSWEAWMIHGKVGEPVETWEPATVVKNTEALATWKSSRTPTASPSILVAAARPSLLRPSPNKRWVSRHAGIETSSSPRLRKLLPLSLRMVAMAIVVL